MRIKRYLVVTTAVVLLLVPSCAIANHPPIIASLKAEPEAVRPSASCQIECIATDEDGDELSYEWFASKGKIDANGATATWTAPHPEGSYDISVNVTDGNGVTNK